VVGPPHLAGLRVGSHPTASATPKPTRSDFGHPKNLLGMTGLPLWPICGWRATPRPRPPPSPLGVISRHTSTIHHLLFADDLLIFDKATLKEASCVQSCLNKYCLWSGQTINNGKSSIIFSRNTNPSTINLILEVLPFPSNSIKSIYLGLPILFGNSKKYAFQHIIEKVKSKVEGWRAKSLSQAGRLVLIKLVAAAIPSYAMRSMKDVNLALISKLGRKLLSGSESLWASQLTGKYLQTGSFFPPLPILSLLGFGKEYKNLNLFVSRCLS
jgi:hypothetical protein